MLKGVGRSLPLSFLADTHKHTLFLFRSRLTHAHAYTHNIQGLLISRQLAGMMRGDLVVDSVEGCGTVFTLTIPAELAGPADTMGGAGVVGQQGLGAAPTRSADAGM